MARSSHVEMTGNAQVPAHDLDEVRIAFGGPDRHAMADRPEQKPRDPEPQPQAERRSERAIENGDGARRTAEQDRLGQGAAHSDRKAGNRLIGMERSLHQITAPPPNEKNARKKLDAAKAIESPKTIWISRSEEHTSELQSPDHLVCRLLLEK